MTAGTIVQGSRQPLTLWFRAIWWVTAQKNGASALGLQRILGLRQYRTAWTWLHKLRRAMVHPERDRLSGCVEVDEIYVGGREKGARTFPREKVSGGGRRRGGRGRHRAHSFALRARRLRVPPRGLHPGRSRVRTDGWSSYSQLEALGYRHRKAVTGGNPKRIDKHFPQVHRVAALLKRWLLGTHQGPVGKSHLNYYLDEFTFRFNRRTSRSRRPLFYRLPAAGGCHRSGPGKCAHRAITGPHRRPGCIQRVTRIPTITIYSGI